jgi:ribosomal protein S18 acetylase RimI-like enzyme
VLELFADGQALERTSDEQISELTRRATDATYHADGFNRDEITFIDRVLEIAAASAAGAACNPRQRLIAAVADGQLAGFVIATVHSEDNRELDWLMVDPRFHGAGVASPLMRAAMEWLGEERPMWLNVVRHNERAIRFYRKHGFEIDPDAHCDHVMPHWIMRRG